MKESARNNGEPIFGSIEFAVGISAATMSMIVLQLGAALSKPAMESYGSLEVTWLRLMWSAMILLIFVRPKILSYSNAQWKTAIILGSAMAMINICFYQALLYLPIGIVTSIEFLGPLSVSAYYLIKIRRSQIIWPVLATIGVLLLTVRLGSGSTFFLESKAEEIIGLALSFGAAVGWGLYVVLMKKIGKIFTGLDGLTMSLLAATVISAPFAVFSNIDNLSFESARTTFVLALLVPLLPYTLEMFALRKMSETFFGILMSVEPAISVLVGWIVLNQSLSVMQIAGVGFITIAMVMVMQRKSNLS